MPAGGGTSAFTIDAPGIDLIISYEGFVNGVYNDSQGYATCGYGHLLHRSPATRHDHVLYDGRGKTYFRGLLARDIERVSMAPMRRYIHVDLNAHEIAALASLAFNCGPGALAGTVGHKLNAHDRRGAADAFMLWDNPSVLRPRRLTERALFLTPVHAATRMPWLKVDERRWCLEYDRLLHADRDQHRRQVLRRVMDERARSIAYAAAHQGGWERAHRRQRHASLAARS